MIIDDRIIVWLDVHDSDHNRFELLQQEWSVLVREASDFRGHNDDFYFKTTWQVHLNWLIYGIETLSTSGQILLKFCLRTPL